MLKSGWRHRNQLSVDQFAPPQPRRLEQFRGGHKMVGGDHNRFIIDEHGESSIHSASNPQPHQ